ncbi:MAG: hypothetical protein ACI8QD_000766 [Cyclobacteriaceae bacterium]|jgi:hypothetical protein
MLYLFRIGGLDVEGRSQDFEGVMPVFGYALREKHPHLAISQTSHRRLLDGYGFLTYRPSKYISFGYALRSNAPIDGQEMRLGRQSVITYTPNQTHQFIWSNSTYHKFSLGSDSQAQWIKTCLQSVDIN